MRSRAEWLLRALSLASLALLLAGVFSTDSSAPRTMEAGGSLNGALREATRSPVNRFFARFDDAPDRVARDWLAALRSAGVSLSWDSRNVPPIALAASAVAEPVGGVRLMAAGAGGRVDLSDSLGLIDSLRIGDRPAVLRLRTASGEMRARSGSTVASVDAPHPVTLRRILVLGPAGWESKFVVTALEEMGWEVDARLDVAPGAVVTQGAGSVPDTASHSAVVLLDGSGAGRASSVARYVTAGGGAILVGSSTRLGALSPIAPAIAGQRMAARPRAEGAARNIVSAVSELPAARLVSLRADASVLVARGAAPLVAARRAGRGRVVSSGLDETWRWRMRADSGARAAHAEWWSSLVGSVAMTVRQDSALRDSRQDPAPLAAVTMALGRSEARPPGRAGGGRPWVEVFLYGVFAASILAEVFSRRKRGLP